MNPGVWLNWRECLELAAVSALLLALSFPTPDLGWLAWIALIPLMLVCLRARRAAHAFWSGYLAGAIFFGATCPWVYYAVRHYGGLPAWQAAVVLTLFVALMGVFFALFGVGGYWLARHGALPWLALPALWTALEWLRTYTPLGGFPWNLLGYAGVDHAGFMLSATVAGVYGASFLIAVENAMLAWVVAQVALAHKPLYRTAMIAPLAIWAVVIGFASFPYDPPGIMPAHLPAVLVQPNAPLDAAWTDASFRAYLARLAQLSQPGPVAPPPALILWPESPAPLDYGAEPQLRTALASLAEATHAEVLLGETTLLDPRETPDRQQPVNAALLIHGNGAPGQRYDKVHLVPFGEYVPLPGWIQHLGGVGKMVAQAGDFLPGHRSVLFQYDGPGPPGGYRFSALICYESIFPRLARRAVALGAQWLVNLSDDGWYGHSSARAQGLEMARMRSIETRRWLLRDTNNGITAIIDPYGRVTAQLPLGEQGALHGSFAARSDTTFYTRHGDWLPLICTILIAVLAAWRRPSPGAGAA